MTTLKANGIFTEFDESGMRLSEAGAIKKAAIECGRRRGEALYDLSEGPLKAFVSAHPGDDATGALKDRKVTFCLFRHQHQHACCGKEFS